MTFGQARDEPTFEFNDEQSRLGNIADFVRAMVRPAVTLLTGIAFVWLLKTEGLELAAPVGTAWGAMVGFWFNSREKS